ncbi:hypothetical protein Tco_1226041 [Tanacetum coccineum]
MKNVNPSSTLGSHPQEPIDTTHAKFTARINKLLTMRQTIDSLLFKTINEMTNQSFDSEIFYLEERIKELELRTQRRNHFEEELFRNTVMSSASSAVTYTSINTNSEPGRPVAPPLPDHIPDSEEPQTPPVPQEEDELSVEERANTSCDSPTAVTRYVVDLIQKKGIQGNDDDDDSSGDDADDMNEDEEDEEDDEEEEHLAPTDSAIIVPTVELVSPPEGTEPVIPHTLPRHYYLNRVGLFSMLQASHIPSPEQRDDVPEFEQPPRKRACLFPLGSRYEVGESSTARPTGEVVPEIAPMTVEEVNTRVTELAELHEHDTQDLYALSEDAQDNRTRIS